MEIFLSGKKYVPNFTKCSDWWLPERQNIYVGADTTVYPIGPGQQENSSCSVPSVELSFEMIEKLLTTLQAWYEAQTEDKSTGKKRAAQLKKCA